jgi:chromosome segregation ATPase
MTDKRRTQAEKGVQDLQAHLAEQRAALEQARTQKDQLDAEWHTLCLQMDVEGANNQGDIQATEYQRFQVGGQIERAAAAITEMEQRLDRAQDVLLELAYEDDLSEYERLADAEPGMQAEYDRFAQALADQAGKIHTHRANRRAMGHRLSAYAGAHGLPSPRLPSNLLAYEMTNALLRPGEFADWLSRQLWHKSNA